MFQSQSSVEEATLVVGYDHHVTSYPLRKNSQDEWVDKLSGSLYNELIGNANVEWHTLTEK